ncbi:hypothetical protein J2W22_003037 [Sphingomonas kyeonggiensis]|uniref:hypothetical protein n=1 Tax=Sphingomonas kyeonggiensis TaxID=1268553 RepID=UPI00277E5F80|nr:hypothetical protein [Sphingomonas kyeonggiensis]MDQ0250973.1 hypothetical protein [Sphingomonas kyeonggiensis]
MQKLPALLDAAGTLLAGLVPGAIGATVTLAFERGLTWGQRFLQLAVGTVVSFYAARMVGAIWHGLDPFVMDGVKFTIGMIAFKATPRFIASAVDVVAGVPGIIRDRYLPKGE